MKDEYFSANHEPALHGGGFKPDPAERRADRSRVPRGNIEAARDSVLNEPALGAAGHEGQIGAWIAERRATCSTAGNIAVTLAAALAAGPFAVVGAFLSGQQGWSGVAYMVFFAPIIEELLKQSGMVFLLERYPYRLFARWQFVVSAVVAALCFAAIENLLYTGLYVRPGDVRSWEMFVVFRWTVPTAMHVAASVVASLGLVRVWRKQQADGRPADLAAAFGYFVAAIAVHGVYNLLAIPLGYVLFAR